LRLLVAIVEDGSTEAVMDTAREAGATGATVIPRARGADDEGFRRMTGLDLDARQDVVLFVVPDQTAAPIIERLESAGLFRDRQGSGIVFQLDIEDSVGLRGQFTLPSEKESDP